MTRASRTLALVTIAFSTALAIYSFPQSGYSIVEGPPRTLFVFEQLSTTATALGLTLAIMALVVSAQARRWRWFSVYLVLAIVTIYGPELVRYIPLLGWFPNLFAPLLNLDVYLQWEVLSFCIPPIATALLVLVEEYGSRAWNFSAGPMEGEADDLEVTPL